MRRREFITGAAGLASIALPFGVCAQEKTFPTVGFLNVASAESSEERVELFRRGLSDAGFVEGRTIAVEYRWANGRYEVLADLVADLLRRKVSVFAATGGAAVRAVKAAAPHMPIVFYIGDDPITAGFVSSLNRPGGNITGIYNWSQDVGPKRLQLLKELVPTATVVGHLLNHGNAAITERRSRDMRVAGATLGLDVRELHASTEDEILAAFESLKNLRASGLLIGGDLFFAAQSERLAALAERYAVPAVSEYRQFAKAGGLAAYGVGLGTDSYLQLGAYVGRILKGEKAADLPVQQATALRMVLNLKAAKALRLTVSLPLLGRADEVFE
jgi:putative tryptophan/tyrosine transport system substrate-binding protein